MSKNKRKTKSRRRSRSPDDSSDDPVCPAECTSSEPVAYRRDLYWGSKRRPTHFLALRLTDPLLLASVRTVHEQILGLEPSYIDCLIPLERLHLTLCNIAMSSEHVDNRERCNTAEGANDSNLASCIPDNNSTLASSVSSNNTSAASCSSSSSCKPFTSGNTCEHVVNKLQSIESVLQQSADDLKIQLVGTGHFMNSTLYAKLKDDKGRLTAWVIQLRELIKKCGFDVLEVFDFTPHVTLLKITRAHAVKLRTRYIDGRVLAAMEGVGFLGEQSISNVLLCEKSSTFDSEGFYTTLASFAV